MRSDLLLAFGVPLLLAIIVFTAAISLYPKPPVLQDAYCYNMSAQRILVDGFFAHAVEPPGTKLSPDADTTPGYHLMLAAIYKVSNSVKADAADSVVAVMPAVQGVQFLLVLGIVVCIAACGRLLGGSRLALLSGVLAAFYLPFAWSSSVALSEALGTFLVSLLLLLAIVMNGRRVRYELAVFAGYGVVAGALALVRPAMSLWAAIPLLMVIIRRRTEPKQLLRLVAVTVVAASLLLAPWWIRNGLVLHRFVPLSEGAGLPLFQAAGGPPMSAAEQAAYDSAKASGHDGFAAAAKYRLVQQMRTEPGTLLGERALRAIVVASQAWAAPLDAYWELRYNPEGVKVDLEPFPVDASRSFVSALMFTQYYHLFLVILMIPGYFMIRRSPRLLLPLSLPLYSVAVHAPTLFIDRYFSPVLPAVIVAAGVVLFVAAHGLNKLVRGRQSGIESAA